MTDHIDDIQQRLESVLQRLAPLRNEAMDLPLEQFDIVVGNERFDALHAETNEIVRSSSNQKVRQLGGARFRILGRWKSFEPIDITAGLSLALLQKHQVGEMCAKLDHEIRAFIREDLLKVETKTKREGKLGNSAAEAIRAAFPNGPPTLLQMSGPVFCNEVRKHLPKDWKGDNITILRKAGRRK